MTTTDHDLVALCAAIDAGDDSALPVLADLLEERGDPRAVGLRRFAHRPATDPECAPDGRHESRCVPSGTKNYRGDGVVWWRASPGRPSSHSLVADVFDRLKGGTTLGHRHNRASCYGERRMYPTRSAALLALAAALA